jgi:hypothetical protein
MTHKTVSTTIISGVGEFSTIAVRSLKYVFLAIDEEIFTNVLLASLKCKKVINKVRKFHFQ